MFLNLYSGFDDCVMDVTGSKRAMHIFGLYVVTTISNKKHIDIRICNTGLYPVSYTKIKGMLVFI